MLVTVYLCRHGQATDIGGITGGGEDPHLTKNGKKEAKKLGEIFQNILGNPDLVVHSGLHRSRETAEKAFKGKIIPFIENPAFKEIYHRSTEKMPGSERKDMWQDYLPLAIEQWKAEHSGKELDPELKFNIHPRDGETWNEVKERVCPEILKLAKEYYREDKQISIAIIAHNAVIQRVMADWLIKKGEYPKGDDGLYPLFFEKSLLENCSIAKFTVNLDTNEIEYLGLVKEKS